MLVAEFLAGAHIMVLFTPLDNRLVEMVFVLDNHRVVGTVALMPPDALSPSRRRRPEEEEVGLGVLCHRELKGSASSSTVLFRELVRVRYTGRGGNVATAGGSVKLESLADLSLLPESSSLTIQIEEFLFVSSASSKFIFLSSISN